MIQVTRRMSPLTSLLGIVIMAALAAPVISFADTATPPNSIGIPAQSDRPADFGRNHQAGRPGRHADNGTGGNPVQPVPEPGTMALMGMGVLALGATIRKRWNR